MRELHDAIETLEAQRDIIRRLSMNKITLNTMKGERIDFKPIRLSDAEAIHSYASDEDVSRFIGWPLMQTLDETRAYIEELLRRETEQTHLYASIVLKSTEEVIGTAMVFNFDHVANHAEVGYVLHRDHWGKGYITEAVSLMNAYAFNTLKLHKLYARVVDANIGSSKVLEKNDYILEGRLKDHFFIEGSYYDELLYGNLYPK